MYIAKNALQNLVLNRGRNLMIGAIILVIIISTVMALMICNTADGVIADFESRFGAVVHFVRNMEKMMEEYGTAAKAVGANVPAASPEDLIRFGESDTLQRVIYEAASGGNSEELRPINAFGRGAAPWIAGGQVWFTLLGGDMEGNVYYDFLDGTRRLTEGGRYPERDYECIISQELLENSGVSIGDTFTITTTLAYFPSGLGSEVITDISWELIIVGTYDDLTHPDADDGVRLSYTNRRNEVITTFNTLAEKVLPENVGINIFATFYLKNPEMLTQFAEEVRAKGLSDLYDVSTDAETYYRMVRPIIVLKWISIVFLIIILALGATILTLLISVAIRERKYEIGVLRAMGMKKGKVVLGLWIETLAIVFICLIIGICVGTVITQPVSNALIDIANTNGMGGTYNQFATSLAAEETLGSFNVSLDLLTILEITGISLLLSSLSAAIATRKITKYEPIKILMERN